MPPNELMPLDQPTRSEGSGWEQVHVEFIHWDCAEHTAALQLFPLLDTEAGSGGWWFVRKQPCWRMRYRPTDHDAPRRIATALDDLVGMSAIRGWICTIYEPETHAFGGPAAMDVAHELFHHDSRCVLGLLHHDCLPRDAPTGGTVSSQAPLPGRRELTVIAISLLLRAAGQDWFEQGDVWVKVADLRRAEHAALPVAGHSPTSLRRLMTIDAGPSSTLATDGPLTPLAEWLAAFEHAGHRLADLSRRGSLQRGLRAVLAHHVIFHWNRIGLAHTDQLVLSTLARNIVMSPTPAITS